jgi:hypothetical protein
MWLCAVRLGLGLCGANCQGNASRCLSPQHITYTGVCARISCEVLLAAGRPVPVPLAGPANKTG